MSIMEKFRSGYTARREPARRHRVNWLVFFTGQLFWLIETTHFGWNAFPESDAEVICDGIVFLITALAFISPPRSEGDTK